MIKCCNVSAVSKEDVAHITGRSKEQRRLSMTVGHVYICASSQHGAAETDIAIKRCVMKHAYTFNVLLIGVGARLQQESCEVSATRLHSGTQGCARTTPRVDAVGPGLQQLSHRL